MASPIGNENRNVWARLDAFSSLINRYLWGDHVDQQLGRIDLGPATPYWTLQDRLGSIRDVINNSGLLQDDINYDAFGNITAETDATHRGWYAYSGREYDTETNLQYNHARWYDATMGRWISQDPLGFDAGDSNLYRYVNNGPTNATDPSGLQDWRPQWHPNGGLDKQPANRNGGLDKQPANPAVSVAKETNKQVGKVATGLAGDLMVNKKYRLFLPTDSTHVVQIRDMTLGKPGKGKTVFTLDCGHMYDEKPLGPHINTTRGHPWDHRPISYASFESAKTAAKGIKLAQRIAKPVAIVSDGIRIFDAIAEDEWVVGENTVTTVAIVGGEWGGAWAGAAAVGKGGAILGFMIGGPPGAAIGRFLGGILGGIAGSYAGGYVVSVGLEAAKTGPPPGGRKKCQDSSRRDEYGRSEQMRLRAC
jgi:RHS repeat-associated protein